MSKKETIEDQVKALSRREEKLKLQLSNDSDDIKEKAKHVGKIALVAGLVAIIGYWIFTIFSDDDEEEKPKKKKKKRKAASGGISSRLTALAIPYLEKMISGVMEDSEEPEKSVKKKEKAEED